ncbi:MAG: PilW family protein [Halothiobacillus sp.]
MNKLNRPSVQIGFTLIELMIALVLGLVLIGGVISVLLSNQKTYRTNTALSQLQDNARTAFELLARDIRQAGSTPCGNASVTNLLNGAAGATYIWGANPIQGFDSGASVTPTLTGALAQSAIVTQGVGVVSTPMLTSGGGCTTGAPLASAPSGIVAGDLVLMCDAGQAYIYQAGAFNGTVLPMAGTGTTPGNTSTTTGCTTVGQTAYVAQYQPDYWYIAPAGAGAPTGTNSLYRARYSGATNAAGAFAADEIIRGVTNLQLTYHMPPATGFVNAAGVGTNWAAVDAVQVSLTLRTLTNPNNVNANQQEPLVRTFTTTVGIRR